LVPSPHGLPRDGAPGIDPAQLSEAIARNREPSN
jgi:hypothetical protein